MLKGIRLPPPHDPNHIEYVGLIASNWAQLEFYIDTTSWRLANIKPEVGSCFSANLGSIHLKLRTLYALLELHEASKSLKKDFRAYQNRISGTADKRNRVVHDPWMTAVWSGGQGMSQFVSRADSKGREFGSKIVPLSDLVKINQEIYKRIDQFFKLREKIAAELPAFGNKRP